MKSPTLLSAPSTPIRKARLEGVDMKPIGSEVGHLPSRGSLTHLKEPTDHSHWIVLILWTISLLATYLLALNLVWSFRLMGLWVVAFSLWAYHENRGNLLDATSVLSLANLLFVGVATLIIPSQRVTSVQSIAAAVLLAEFFILAVVACSPSPARVGNSTSRSTQVTRRFVLSAPALLAAGTAGFVASALLDNRELFENFSYGLLWSSPLVATLGAAAASSHRKFFLLLPVGLLAWHLSEWGGGGRLTILALTVGMVMAYQYQRPPKTAFVKAIFPLFLIPGLLFAAAIETNRGGEGSLLYVPSGFQPLESLYSVWSPLDIFQVLLERELGSDLVHHGVHTFVAAALVWVPSWLWTGKPEGWGRDLAWEFNPQAADLSAHAEAGLAPAEFLWAHGLPALVLGAIAIAVLTRFLNAGLHRLAATNVRVPSGYAAPITVAWIVASTGLMTLWWSGTFNYTGRVFSQFLGLGLMIALGWTLARLNPFARGGARRIRRQSAMRGYE